jgi:hypothetical protein
LRKRSFIPLLAAAWNQNSPALRLTRNKNMLKSIFVKIKQNHALMMILCCGIPIVGIMALSSLGIRGSWGYYALILVCPLGHTFMMRGMHSTPAESKMPAGIIEIEQKL